MSLFAFMSFRSPILGHSLTCEALIRFGADVNAVSKSGTAAEVAERFGFPDCVEVMKGN